MTSAVFSFARMNPLTLGHEKVARNLIEIAAAHGCTPKLVLSETHDPKNNPLTAEEKIAFARRALKGVEVRSCRSLGTIVEELAASNVDHVTFVIGRDRAVQFRWMKDFFAKAGKSFDLMIVDRNDEISATNVRDAALRGDFESFSRMVPCPDETFTIEMYNAVRRGLEVNATI